MIGENESSIIEEIEKEVMRVVKMAEEVNGRASTKAANTFKVRYLQLLRDYSRILEAISGGELVIASLEGLEGGVLKKAVKEVREEVMKKGGSLYFISKPVILILPEKGYLVDAV